MANKAANNRLLKPLFIVCRGLVDLHLGCVLLKFWVISCLGCKHQLHHCWSVKIAQGFIIPKSITDYSDSQVYIVLKIEMSQTNTRFFSIQDILFLEIRLQVLRLLQTVYSVDFQHLLRSLQAHFLCQHLELFHLMSTSFLSQVHQRKLTDEY